MSGASPRRGGHGARLSIGEVGFLTLRAARGLGLQGRGFSVCIFLPLVSREWKNGSNSSYNCTPFLHSLLTKGKYYSCAIGAWGLGFRVSGLRT